jgi:hypothetical protein
VVSAPSSLLGHSALCAFIFLLRGCQITSAHFLTVLSPLLLSLFTVRDPLSSSTREVINPLIQDFEMEESKKDGGSSKKSVARKKQVASKGSGASRVTTDRPGKNFYPSSSFFRSGFLRILRLVAVGGDVPAVLRLPKAPATAVETINVAREEWEKARAAKASHVGGSGGGVRSEKSCPGNIGSSSGGKRVNSESRGSVDVIKKAKPTSSRAGILPYDGLCSAERWSFNSEHGIWADPRGVDTYFRETGHPRDRDLLRGLSYHEKAERLKVAAYQVCVDNLDFGDYCLD